MEKRMHPLAALAGKYVKVILGRLEEAGVLTPEIRKAVLDTFGEYARDIDKALSK